MSTPKIRVNTDPGVIRLKTRSYFQIRTPSGYVGRHGLTTEMMDDCSQANGYTWDSIVEAEKISQQYPDSVIEVVLPDQG